MDTSGEINALGKQYIGAGGPQIASSETATAMAPSIPAIMIFALIISIAKLHYFEV
jgi:hypothetical protein